MDKKPLPAIANKGLPIELIPGHLCLLMARKYQLSGIPMH